MPSLDSNLSFNTKPSCQLKLTPYLFSLYNDYSPEMLHFYIKKNFKGHLV